MSVAYVEPLTKSEEIELFSGIVETLSEGYIRDILKDLQPQIVDAVRNDFGFITADLQRDVADLKTERETLQTEIKRLREQSESMLTSFHRAQRVMREAETLQRSLREIVSKIRDL